MTLPTCGVILYLRYCFETYISHACAFATKPATDIDIGIDITYNTLSTDMLQNNHI